MLCQRMHMVDPIPVGVLTSRAINARMGDKSIVPFNGGMMPRNKFRYGSHRVLRTHKVIVSAHLL